MRRCDDTHRTACPPYSAPATLRRIAITTPACPACGRSAGPDDRFCGQCGTAITATCEHCGRVNAAGLPFCTGCGRPSHSGLPSHAGQGGRLVRGVEERRRVSVLFIDAVGSTPFAERADPETVRAHQSEFFAAVRRVVRQYGGIVEKFIGDAAMALFGAPVATGTDAVRCVRAGLDLQRVLAGDERSAGWVFRVGIATGEALVDVAAAHDGGQAIVAGDVVNTAARLQSLAPRGGVLVCGTTCQATRTEICYVAQEPVTLRGRSAPTEVWLASAAQPQQISAAPEDTDEIAMVGRDHELGLLTSALQHAIRQRTPRLVTILGRAGIGKSRLVRELYRHARRQIDGRLCWRSGRCPPFGENVAYAALADVVKAQAGVLATDTPETARGRLEAALADLVPASELARLCDAVGPLIGLSGSPLSIEDAESAWRRFLVAMAGRGPTVLVLEDLQWADDRMLRFVELLTSTVRDVPLLVVATARPELIDRDPAWAGAVPGMLGISLTPLRDDNIATLYRHMFGADALPPDLLRSLVELADGMPLYAHEYGRMLVERGTLRRAEQRWVVSPGAELPMPESVHAVIANRIDLLGAAERAVLQAASVVGSCFWPGAIAAALPAGTDSVERALRTLTQRDLIQEQPGSTMAGEPEFRFRHVLVGDVCYERLPRAERIARHVRTADWLDAHVERPDTELVELLAHHRFAAFEIARSLDLDTRPYAAPALIALRRAAQRAAMLNAFDAAAIHVARATTLVAGDASDADTLGVELLGAELALHRDATGFLAGDGPDRLAELAALLFRTGDHGGAARAWTMLGQVAWLRSDRRAALLCLDRAVELFDSWPDTPEKAYTYAELGRLHMLNYEHAPALGATQIAADIAERLGLVELRATALVTIGMCRFHAGEPGALADLREALEFCRDHHLPSLRTAAQTVAEALREHGERGHELTEATAGGATPVDSAWPVSSEWRDGDWDRFLADADALLGTPEGERDPQVRGARGWIRVLRGDDGGVTDGTEALSAARSSGLWRPTWAGLAHAALSHAVRDDTAHAADLLRELGESWRKMHTIASGEWVSTASHAAILAGPDAVALLRDVLADAPAHTAWSRAALSSLDGALAATRHDLAAASRWHRDAAERYASLGSRTDRVFALAAAARALAFAGDPDAAALAGEVADFASRNAAPHLLSLAQPQPPPG